MTDTTDRRERNLATLRAAFDAIARGDADELVTHYAEDYVLELPYSDPDAPKVVRGRAAVRDYLSAAFGVFRFSLDDLEVHDTVDPDLIVAEYTSSGTVLTNGGPYRNRYVGFWWFRDGEVVRTREYYDPVASQRAVESP